MFEKQKQISNDSKRVHKYKLIQNKSKPNETYKYSKKALLFQSLIKAHFIYLLLGKSNGLFPQKLSYFTKSSIEATVW